jgi:hypothetical protein
MEDKIIEETIEPKNVVTLEELYEKYVAATHNQMAAIIIADIDHFKSEIKILEERLEDIKQGKLPYYDGNSINDIGDQKLILSELHEKLSQEIFEAIDFCSLFASKTKVNLVYYSNKIPFSEWYKSKHHL